MKRFALISALFALVMVIPADGQDSRNAAIQPDLAFFSIPGGTFRMGDEQGDLWKGCRPVHTVAISAFEMSVCEITNAQYCAYLNEALASDDIEIISGKVQGKTGVWSGTRYLEIGYGSGWHRCWITYGSGVFSVISGYENWPVVYVTWFGSKAFAQYYGLDLPTEAEWEYACRGGLQNKYGTDDGTIDSTKANYDSNIGHLVDAGSYPSNPYGIQDLSGNVWEWCNDWYETYTSESVSDPTGAQSSLTRVIRGGSWPDRDGYCRSAARGHVNPFYGYNNVGFHVVRRP